MSIEELARDRPGRRVGGSGVISGLTQYSGADWIAQVTGKELSPLGSKVADILGFVFRGIYHLEHCKVSKADWTDTYLIRVKIKGDLATFDSNQLTELVILCHEHAIRLNISAVMNRLELMFHQRQREGRFCMRHPSIDEAVQKLRAAANPEVA